MLPSAQRIFDAARFLVAIGTLATAEPADRLQRLIRGTPSAAIDAYRSARDAADRAADARDRVAHERVALTIASSAAMVGIVVD